MDTRTIYLHTDNKTFTSDPSETGNVEYLDVSEYDNLNPTRATVIAGGAGSIATAEPYEANFTLTFSSRESRGEWVQTYADNITRISVANAQGKSRVYNKRCTITGLEFIDNPYINGVQTKITLKLFGKWQSSLTKLDVNVGTYEGGSKQFTTAGIQGLSYVYSNQLSYGQNNYRSAIDIGNEHGFVINAGVGTSVNLTLSTPTIQGETFTLSSAYPDLITGLSSELVGYPHTEFDNLDRFTILENGSVLAYGWKYDDVSELIKLFNIANNVDTWETTIAAATDSGSLLPVDVYAYSRQDFI